MYRKRGGGVNPHPSPLMWRFSTNVLSSWCVVMPVCMESNSLCVCISIEGSCLRCLCVGCGVFLFRRLIFLMTANKGRAFPPLSPPSERPTRVATSAELARRRVEGLLLCFARGGRSVFRRYHRRCIVCRSGLKGRAGPVADCLCVGFRDLVFGWRKKGRKSPCVAICVCVCFYEEKYRFIQYGGLACRGVCNAVCVTRLLL